MSPRTFRLPRRRLVVAGLALAAIAVMVAVITVTTLSFGARIAHGGGTGGGGCISTTTPVCTFKSNSAFVDFGTVSSDGCTFIDASVSPFQSLSRPGSTDTSSVLVSISKYNGCTGMQTEMASNIDPTTFTPDFTGSMQFGGNLSSATVTGSAPMYDYLTGALLFTTTINVVWQGYGPSTHNIDSEHSHGPGFVFSTHFNGTSRSAEASGTVTDETGTNLVATPTIFADLDNASGGTLQMFKS